MVLRNRAACALVLALLSAGCARTAPRTPRPPVRGIQIDPAEPKVGLGEAIKVTALAVLADGTTQELDAAEWTVAEPALATLRADRGIVWVTGVQAGETRLSVLALGLAAEVPLSVTGAKAVKLALSPAETTLGLGALATFKATATLSDQSTLDVTASAAWSAADLKVVSAGTGAAKGTFTGLATGSTSVKATYQGLEATAKVTVNGAKLVRVDVTPSKLLLPLKTSLPLQAIAVFDDASVSDVTAQATWASSSPAIASVDGGVVTGLGTGEAAITATFSEQVGTAVVTVTAAQLKAVEVSPPTLQLAKGSAGSFQATALFTDGLPPQDVTQFATWETKDPKIASVVAGTPGAVQGQAPGETEVVATFLGLAGTARVSVTAAKLTALAVNPTRQTVPKGSTAAYQATGTYSDSSSQDVTEQVLWKSGDEALATISNAAGSKGVAQAKAAGTVTLTAALDGLSGQATLEISLAQVVKLVVSPDFSVLAKGTTGALKATAEFTDLSSSDVTDQADWSSSDNAVASVSTLGAGRGVVSAVKPGSVTVTAAFSGKTASATVVVSPATLASLSIEPLDPSAPKGSTQQMKAIGTYSDGTRQDVTTQVIWSVVNPAIARASNATGTQGLVSALSEGTTKVEASLSGQVARTSFTVTAATLTGLKVAPSPVTLEYKATQQLVATATYSDGTVADVTTSTAWSSDDPSIASVVGGLVTGNRAGKTVVTASFGGKTVKVDVTVNAPKLTKLEIRPASLSLPAGRKGQLACWAIYADGSQVEVTLKAAWSASPGNVRVDSAGAVTAVSQGTSTVTATFEGFLATAKVDVTAPEVDTLTITPTTAKIPQGSKQSFTVRAFLSDGTSQDVTAQTLFEAAPAGLVNLVGNTATGMAQGVATITARYGGKTATAQLTIGPPVVVDSLRIDPTFADVSVGGTRSFTVTAVNTDGTSQDVTSSTLFVSADPSTVGLQGNQAIGVKVGGPVTLTASYGGKSVTAQVKVSPASIVSLAIQPAGLVLQKGESGPLKAMATYSDGTVKDVTSLCTWDSSSFLVCSVLNGTVKGVGAGTATVTASLNGLKATATIVVEAPVLNRIALVPPNAVLRPNLIYPYRAYGLYSDGTVKEVPRDETYWRADNPSVLQPINYTGYFGVWAVAVGTTDLYVNYDSGMGSTTGQVLNSPITGVEVSPAKVILPKGTAAKLAGVFVYKSAGDGWAAEIQNPDWQSNDPSVATIDANGVATSVRLGTTQIQVTTFDGMGMMYTASTDVTVTSATLVSIELSMPARMVVGLSTRIRAMGTFSDGTVMDLGPSAVIYSTSDASLATVVTDVDGAKVTARAAGPVTISATLLGVTKSVPVTLAATTLSTLNLSVAQTTLAQGSTSRLTVTGNFADGTALDLTDSATYTSSAPDVAQVLNGVFTNLSWPMVLAHAPSNPPQNASVTATFQGKSASANIRVNGVNLRSLALALGTAAPSPTLTLAGGGPFQLRVVGTFTDNSTADVTAFCTFSPAAPGPGVAATISNALAGKVTVLAKGSETVKATYAPSYIGQPLISGTATLVVP